MDKKDYFLSVVIIAFNEEQRLAQCLSSLPVECEIVVVDSFSSDATVELARSFGAKVFSRRFDDYATQKNYAISKAEAPWILSLDADEVLSRDLADEVIGIAKGLEVVQAYDYYRVPRILNFRGKAMRFGKTKDRPLRLFRNGKASFEGIIHEQIKVDAKASVGELRSFMIHYSYANLTDYLSKLNRYTSKIAENHYGKGKRSPFLASLPLRFFWEFGYRYFFRLGLLDGYQGYCYALYSSVYAFTKYEKLREIYELKDEV